MENQNNPLVENNTTPEEQVKESAQKAPDAPEENVQSPVDEAEKAKAGATEFSDGSFAAFEQPYRPYEPRDERYGNAQKAPSPPNQYVNQNPYANQNAYCRGAQNQYAHSGYNQYTPYGYNNQNQYNGNPYGQNPYVNQVPYGQELYRAATAPSRVSPVVKILAWISFGFSIFAAFMSLIFAVASSEPGFNGLAACLVCSLFPIAALVFGIIMARKRAGGTKFIIVGAITLSFSLLFSLIAGAVGSTDYATEVDAAIQIAEVEELLNIDLPDYYDFESYEYTQLYSASYFENTYYIEDISAMRMLVAEDSRFMTKLPNSYIGMLPEESRADYSPSAILFYNMDDETFNTLPKKNGTYNMLCIRYYDYDYEAYYVITEYELYFVSDMGTADI